MSRRNQDLVSRVRFEVDSRMANATMQALQTHAEKLNQQVAEVNASIKALGDVPDDNPALQEYRKQLRRLNSDLKDVNTTMKDYTRGVKAAGELYRHYAMGNIEDMSIKAIRAGVNGMKKRLDNLKAGGDPGDAEEMRLIEAITTEADVVVKRFKTDYQHVVEEIARGGTVTEQTLKRTRDGLADLMQTAETEAEKNELTNYWQKVGAAIEAVAVENRRLRGEVADREEAMRIAYATDHDGSQQAIHDAEARADAARRENDELRQRLDLKQQQRRELEQEMDINSMQVRSLMDRRDELKAQEKEDRAIRNQRVDDANKELNAARRAAKTQQQAYDEQKQTVEKLRTEVQGLTDDIRKMGEVKAEPKIDTSELELEKLNQKIQKLKQDGMYDPAEGSVQDAIAERKRLISDYEKEAEKASRGMDRSKEGSKTYEKHWEEWSDADQWREAYEIQLKALQELEKAEKEKLELEQKLAAAQQQSTTAHQQSAQSSEQLAQKQEQLSQKTAELNQQQDKLNGMVDETVTANQRLARAEQEQTDARNAQAEAKKHEGEAVKKVEEELRGLTDEQLKNAQAYSHLTEEINADTAAMQRNITTEQEATREADRLRSGSIDKMEQALARLRESNRKLDPTIDKEEWERGERAIGQLNLRLEELKKQSAELRGEWMTVADAMKYADSIGSEGFVTTDAETKKATEALQRQRETLVSLIHEKERDGDATADERQELALLETALAKISTGFADADDVMRRFNQHMGESKTASEGMGHAFDEATSARISDIDESIKQVSEIIKDAEEEVKRDEEMIARLEKEMKNLQTLYNNGVKFIPGIGKAYKKAIEKKRDLLEGNDEDELGWKPGLKQDQEDLAFWKERLEVLKQERAETIQQAAAEQEVQKARRMTREEMQEGIKVLEAEAMAQDRSTADGQKRWEELRKTIDEMNKELKEATGEWMKLDDAQKIAEGAGKKGFAASAQEIQQATQALERRREELIKQIRAERDLGNAVDAQEKELDDLTKKLRSLKFEQDNVNMSQEKMHTLIETPANAVNLDELRAAIKRADGQLRQMQQSLGENSSEYKRFAEQVRNAKNVMKEMEGQAKASATAWEKAFSRLKTYVVMYMGFNEVWQKITGTMGDMLELSDKMGEVRKTTGFTADEVGRLSENLKKMDVRTSLTSLMEISASAGQLGLKTLEDVQGFTEAANKLMIALPEMGREAATEMMRVAIATGEVDKIRKQLQEGTIEGSSATAVAMEKIASTIDRLRASSASTAPEITDFVKRVGAVGAQSGITIDQVAALGSTVSSLGMRIEMSATALSRMIPAIRNNAFELAKAIGVTPDTIRNLFDTGRGMEVILMILQRIKDTGMDADSVEQMLGMAGMRDIMKDLNQQGARAGIVFSGLSQNVDELRRQLGVAGEAYEENIAIQQEFDKMNETTAAKWERLKNAFEEGFVGDKPQRLLGGIIDGLRKIVDFMVGDSSISSAFRTILVYLGLVRMQLISLAAGALTSVGGGLRNIGIMLGFIKGEMTKLQWGNIFTALAGAVLYAYMAFKDLKSAAEKAQESLGKTKDDVARAQEQFEGYWRKLKDTSTALEQARKSHDQLSAEVDKLRNSTDKGAAATENLRKKEDELKKSEDNVAKASNDHKTAISQMNSIYGKYLGFILTETNYANLAAAAHNKVAAAIEREMLMKQKQAAISEVDSNYSADIASNYGKLSERLTQQGLNRSQASQAMADLQKFLRKNVSYDAATNETTVSKAVTDQLKRSGLNLSKATSNEIVALWYDKYLKDTYHLSDRARMNITGVKRTADRDERWQNVYSPFATNVRGGYADTYVRRERERGSVSAVYNADITRVEGEETKAAGTLLQKLEKEASDAKTKILDKATSDKDRNDAYINLANALEGLDNRINELDPKRDAETINRLRDMAKSLSGEGISVKKLTAARREIHSTLFDRATFDENAIREVGNANPWGTSEPGESTNWKEMTAEQLVNRREQMNKFVNSLQTDTDVKAVLNEDKALKKAIEAGMSSDMRTVIEWYNTERLKIQDELHARHLTNTGDWLDPKKERGAKKQFRDEMDAYLHELDAYYTERKTRIEEAGTDEGLTEAEIRNRTLANEMEWQQRRAELQKLYSRKQKEVTQEELNAIYHIISERTGDSESFVKAQIAKTNQFVDAIEKSGDKGAAIVHRWMSQVELDTERSYMKGQQALTKQMKAIEDIIDKERPFNGITKQLRESLSTMDILTGDMRKEYDELMKAGKDMRDFNERQGRAELQRTTFLLGQAEQAYSTTIDRVMQQMREKNMGQWADWLSIRPEQQEALMAQLRQTYDAIQDAIKKEASQLKKQAEIMWNNILVPGGDGKTTMKQMLDRTVSQLGIDQGSVSRANSLIGAGASSERVADKLAIQQMRLQLTMQEHYYNLMKKQGRAHVDMLNQQADAAERRGEAEEATRKRLDAQHAEMALNLATAKEETELAKQREEIIARTEESQNRLYTELRSWADLLTSSLQGVFEASSAGNREYYNELAKMNLTGKGGPGAGTYMVIENEGTDEARAHYEWLDQREALERQHQIEIQNAQADAWKKVMDDLNQKMSEQITDWMNAAALDANTQALWANTDALMQTMNTATTPETTAAAMQPISQEEAQQYISAMGDNPAQFWTDLANGVTPESLKQPAQTAPVTAPETAENVKVQQPEIVQNTDAITGLTSAVTQLTERIGTIGSGEGETAAKEAAAEVTEDAGIMPAAEGGTVSAQWPMTEEQVETIKENTTTLWEHHADAGIEAMQRMAEATADLPSGITDPWPKSGDEISQKTDLQQQAWGGMADIATVAMDRIVEGQGKVQKGEEDTEKKMVKGSQSTFAKMTAAANLYGVAYQAMSNDNLSTAQKFEMIALQAAGNTAIAAMTADFNENMTKTTNTLPQILAKCLGINPIYGPVLFAGLSAVIGGLMGMAASKLAKGKSEVAKVTGASASAGRLSTGMMTYAEGNVNELTDPASLTPGRQYNVDGADGKTYRAKYMGKGAKTHITNGPEFHLVGEAGREAIIDAKTTRLLQMNETGIWRDIQTLYNGGSISGLSTRRRRGGGVAAFAEGNIGEFEDAMGGDNIAANGAGLGFDPIALQSSLDANTAIQQALLERLNQPIVAVNKWTGSDGIPAMYNKMQKEAQHHGEKYM